MEENLNLSSAQQSEVFMNSMLVHFIQLIMIFCIWNFVKVDPNFKIERPINYDMLIGRFVASMMMHINVEKDVRAGLAMMKYAVNHRDKF